MKQMYQINLRVGPATYRIAADWQQPIEQLCLLYDDYPRPKGDFADFTVRLESKSLWRKNFRPRVHISGDFWLPDASPLPLSQGLLAAEMGMNLQMALGWRRHLLLHASTVEKDGKALVMTGLSGSGKSTLSAMLGEKGWRFMGDEFALICPQTGLAHSFPRLISLKNKAITAMEKLLPDDRFGPLLEDTPKGNIRHLIPPVEALEASSQTAKPALLLFPRFGYDAAIREIGKSEIFVRLTQASTNYVALGQDGFKALTSFVDDAPARAIDYQSGDEAEALIDQLWEELA